MVNVVGILRRAVSSEAQGNNLLPATDTVNQARINLTWWSGDESASSAHSPAGPVGERKTKKYPTVAATVAYCSRCPHRPFAPPDHHHHHSAVTSAAACSTQPCMYWRSPLAAVPAPYADVPPLTPPDALPESLRESDWRLLLVVPLLLVPQLCSPAILCRPHGRQGELPIWQHQHHQIHEYRKQVYTDGISEHISLVC